MLLALGACDVDERVHRSPRGESTREHWADVRAQDGPEGLWTIPGEPDPTVATAEPVDLGTSVCFGMRVLRVDRRRGPGSSALSPRFYGRDASGRIVPFEAVLRCELRQMNWVAKPRAEGINLILWRGPAIFEPGNDCDWREPVTTVRTLAGARRMTLREHCRHRVAAGSADREVTVELSADYGTLVRL